jgi:flagellin
MIQTAEGALNETHSILQRMRELAVQSSNDTNVSADRTAIQDEMNQLTSEIDRIANNTEFNTQNLLDGSLKAKFQIGANENQNMDLSIKKMDSSSLGLVAGVTIEKVAASGDLKDGIYSVNGANVLDASGNVVGVINGQDLEDAAGNTVATFVDGTPATGTTITISETGTKAELKNTVNGDALKLSPGEYELNGGNVIKDGKVVGTHAANALTMTDGTVISAAELNVTAGSVVDGFKFTINGADVSTRDSASGTITSVNKAIEQVSRERSKLGAVQNRLEHTIANLNTSSENLQASESRVRDVDMAKEMMNFSKNNILSQAAQAMLAQANSQPQGVLQLLR